MPLLVTGSIGIDTVKTPFGVSENCLGGSAVYFSMAASFFSPVRLVAVVGPDCPFDLGKIFAGKEVDLQGVEVRLGSKTFRWAGSYQGSMNEAITDRVEFNVLAELPPKVPNKYKDSRYVFLANTAPALQLQLLEQLDNPVFIAADTMNCWIRDHLEDLKRLLQRIDALVLNDGETRQLTREHNLAKAAEKILQMGPAVVIIKKGEHGSMMYGKDGASFHLPGYPTGRVKDPTGAGDSFAGALMGYLAEQEKTDNETLRAAIAYGTVVASFTVEDFSTQRLASLTKANIDERFETIRKITRF
jgi:sugar/nucleoside kinase (ribokinase family)